MYRIIINIIIFLGVICMTPNYSNAEFCIEKGKRCIDDQNPKLINEINIYKPCWKYEYLKECYKNEYTDSCLVISNVPGCNKISTACEMRDSDNQCAEIKEQYQCGSLLNSTANITYLDTSYTIVKDNLNAKECNKYILENECYEISNTCVEGAEERIINGKKILKDCWRYEKRYGCFQGSYISDCTGLKNQCQFIDSKCISTNKEGACRHRENRYECSDIEAKTRNSKHCSKARYCIGENCEELKYNSNSNIGAAISGLATLSGLKKDMKQMNCSSGAESCSVFKGKNSSCIINPISTRNCCKDSGWLKDAKLVGCNENEKLLAHQRNNGLCHYIGSYCSKEVDTLGLCLEKKQTYCCFDTKLAKIIHEQGRTQLGIGWGEPKNPNCSALTVDQLQKINFEKIDFKDAYSELLINLNSKKHLDIQEQSIKRAENKALESKYTEALNDRTKGYYEK